MDVNIRLSFIPTHSQEITVDNMTLSRAVKCSCGDKGCDAWHVSPEADVQGVRFTKDEALRVAGFLNTLRIPYFEDQEFEDSVKEAADDAWDVDGFHPRTFIQSLQANGLHLLDFSRTPKITQAELIELFGDSMPTKVVEVLMDATLSTVQARWKIYNLASIGASA